MHVSGQDRRQPRVPRELGQTLGIAEAESIHEVVADGDRRMVQRNHRGPR